jgi:glycosyltransferase involved in cell wall biosynthesis
VTSPLVSVLIPCFNGRRFIAQTLRSVMAQTYRPLEVIVVDDGSTDGSADEVKQFADVKLIRQQNAGAASARNVALAHSRGEFIQYLDADDLLSPDKIALQMARLADIPDCIASAEWGRFYRDPSETTFVPDKTWTDLDSLDWLALSREDGVGMMYPALWLIPRSVTDRTGLWNAAVSTAPGEDAEYFTRAVLAARRVLFCAGARTYYRSGIGGASSRKHFRSQALVIDLCAKSVLAVEDSPRMRMGYAKAWQHLAHYAYPYDRAVALEALHQARTLHPVEIRPGGGRAFEILSSLVGWRLARRLQVWSGRP